MNIKNYIQLLFRKIMRYKELLFDKLSTIAEKPENEFDKIISENKAYLILMNESQLGEMCALRDYCAKLCRVVPYSRNDVASLIENNEVSPYDKVAELENHFLIAECIFTRLRGEKY